MKSYLKFLSRNKLYTFINVLGLSISLMFVILIANYVVRNLTIDNNVENKERIYILGSEDYLGTGYWNGQKLKARYPEVEEACGVAGGENSSVFISDKEYGAKILYADTTFFEMFSIKMLEGDAQTALISKGNVVISKSFANKVFGTANPIGQTVKFTDGKEENRLKTVVGIIPDIENSVLPNVDIITNFLNIGNPSITSERMSNAGSTSMFLLEKEGANLPSKTDDILAFFKTYFWPYAGGASKEVVLAPFKGVYFADSNRSELLSKGDKSFVIILISVGLLILLFSVVNYINLTVAQTGFRAKEMATRRLLGSSRGVLFGKLISESIVMCLVAFVIGFILAITLQPFANDLLQSKIDILKDFSGMYLASYICLIIFVSVLSGVIPASIISNFQPIEVVRGAFRRKTSMVYGKILIAFQNIITVTLIAGSITMLWQINHLINAPMGYNYKNVIDISVWSGFKNADQVPPTVNALKTLPFVEVIGQGQGTPLSGGNNNTTSYGKEKMISFQTLIGDKPYYQILGMEIKKDNKLSSGTGWYFNEYAFKEMGVSEDVPAVKMGPDMDWEIQVAGVFTDFKVRTALSDPTACQLKIINSFEENNRDTSKRKMYPWDILVKVADNYDRESAFNQVKDMVIKETGSTEVVINYMDDLIKESYTEQKRTSDIVMIFTLIAILISSLGLLAMSTYFIQQRQMEISVRKVFGSTRTEVLNRLVSNFMKIVGVAFIISIPVIWYLMTWWLEGYAYRIALSPLIFVGAGLFSCVIAFITVFWQSMRAANQNPIDAIKR